MKKSKTFEKDDEVVILFNFPHAFINPVFFRDEKSQKHIPVLEKNLGLESKKDDDAFGDFKNDFGEQDYFTGLGNWHENKYFEFHYPPS